MSDSKIDSPKDETRGRPRKYKNKKEYQYSCNRHLKFKDMTLEKAYKQRERYERLLVDINKYINENEK